ncbi:MAG TPA: PucR family transcriptional regulator ligand-binding domain-containing protein, partial [Beutenbergiaceae bacterium]|nr:PucR family transcriptional regulator ligand-binding domain-containing protein [Beutenbergiaceae bacterium]
MTAETDKDDRASVQKSMTEAYRVPVKELLGIGGLNAARPLAGHGGLQRSITGLSIIESPEKTEKIRPNTFVMTGGFPLKYLADNAVSAATMLTEFVSNLFERDVAGLGVQLGTHLRELPIEMLSRADELGFPIIELPAEVGLDHLFGQTMVELAQVQAGALHRTEQLLLGLEKLLLEGADIQRIGEELASELGVGVLITSNDGRVMADAFTPDMRHRLATRDLYDDTGRFRVERASLEVTGEPSGSVLAQPIFAAGEDLARLVAFDPDSVIGEDARYALRRASNVVALLITQQQAVNAVENKYRGDFLRDVLSGRSKNREYCEEYAVGLGWRLDMPCMVVSAQIDPQDPREEPATTQLRRSWQSRFHQAWMQVILRESKAFPVADFSDEVVAILAYTEGREGGRAAAVAHLQTMVERVVRRVSGDRGGGRRPFSVGTSRLVTRFEDLPLAYQ